MSDAPRYGRRDALALIAGLGLSSLTVHGSTLAAPVARMRPTLLVTEADIVAARQAIAKDALVAKWYRVLRRQGDALLAEPPTRLEFEAKRPTMLITSRRVLDRVRLLGGLYLLSGDRRYAARAKAELAAADRFPNWNPSHFLDTAEMAHAFALGLDWLADALTKEERARLVGAVVEQGIEPGLDAHAQRVGWTQGGSNWNLVCNGGLILAALAVERDIPARARDLIDQCLASAPHAMASYAPDGAWDEGPSYWAYATQYASFLIGGIEGARGPSALAQSPGFADTGLFGLHMTGPTGRFFNFGDAWEENESGPELFWLSRRFDRPVYATYYRPLVGAHPGILDILWYDPRVQSPRDAGIPTCAYFRHVEVASLRGAWDDSRAAWIAIKGGDNMASHGDLDLGTFVLESGGVRFGIDLGGDNYALPGYFQAPQRYTYYRKASRGQNLCMPSGLNQDSSAKAKVISFAADAEDAHAVLDLDDAWPGAARARRGAALTGGRDFTVVDEIDRLKPLPWTWRMHTRARITLDGPHAVLRQDGAVLHMRIIDPAGARFSVEPVRLTPPEESTKGVRRLAIHFPEAAGAMRVAVLASPLDQLPESALARSHAPLAAWSRR